MYNLVLLIVVLICLYKDGNMTPDFSFQFGSFPIPSSRMGMIEEISTDAATATVLSEFDGTRTLRLGYEVVCFNNKQDRE